MISLVCRYAEQMFCLFFFLARSLFIRAQIKDARVMGGEGGDKEPKGNRDRSQDLSVIIFYENWCTLAPSGGKSRKGGLGIIF